MSKFNVGDRVVWSVPRNNPSVASILGDSANDGDDRRVLYASWIVERFGGMELEGVVVKEVWTCRNRIMMAGVSFEALKANELGHDCNGNCDGYSGQWVLPEHLRHIDAYKFNEAYFRENLDALLTGGLKIEAKKLGYLLVPEEKPVPRILPCSCGRKRIDVWDDRCKVFYACPSCGKESERKPTEREAREAWNEIAGKDVNGDV